MRYIYIQMYVIKVSLVHIIDLSLTIMKKLSLLIFTRKVVDQKPVHLNLSLSCNGILLSILLLYWSMTLRNSIVKTKIRSSWYRNISFLAWYHIYSPVGSFCICLIIQWKIHSSCCIHHIRRDNASRETNCTQSNLKQ